MKVKKVIVGMVMMGLALGYGNLQQGFREGAASELYPRAKPIPTSLTALHFQLNRRISDYAEARFWTHTFSSGGRSLTLIGDTLYAVWYDVRSGNADVYFARSIDGGRTFGPSKRINDDKTDAVQYKPSIGVDARGIIYVAWRDGRTGNADIFFARSTDGGKSFSRNIRLNDDRSKAYQGNPTLAVNSEGYVAVAWSDARNGKDDIYLSVSHDQGRSFSKNRQVNDDPETPSHSHPAVAVDENGTVYAVWEDHRNNHSDIYIARSTDGGKTFSSNRRVNDDSGSAPQISPSIVVGPLGQIYVAWGDFRNSTVKLSAPDAATAELHWWKTSRNGDADIYFSKSTNGGESFSPNLRINDDTGAVAQAFPSLSVNSQGVVAVAWEDFRNGHSDIYIARSRGRGLFDPNQRVNDDTGEADQYHPSLILGPEGKAYLIWTDKRNNRFSGNGTVGDDQGDDVYFAI